MSVLIIVPAYNEADTLGEVINEIRTYAPNADYLVVNDCSSDNTAMVLADMNANYINCPVNLGIGGAVQAGYLYAYKNNYDIAIQLDGDGQHDAKYIPEIVALLTSNQADVVIGSRYIDCEGFQSSTARRTGIRILSGLIWLMCGTKVKDVTSGYRGVNKRFIELFAESYPDDYPEPEVLITSVLFGGRVREIPVVMRERTAGVSSISMKKSVYYMIKVSLAIIITRISLGVRRKGLHNGN